MSQHSKLSPSAAHRWLLCNESLETSGLENKSSPQAIEGTAAHEFASHCLLGEIDAWQCIGNKITVEGIEIECTAEMAEHIQVYLDYCRSHTGGMFVEVALDGSAIHPDLGGTADCIVRSTQLRVIDLKYGAGIYVEVEDNEQLMIYALLAAMQYDLPPEDEVIVAIVQPRAGGEPVRETSFTAVDLYLWRDTVLLPAVNEKVKVFNAGDHCRFCVRGAALRCPLTMSIFKAHHATRTNGGPMSDEELDTRYELLPVVKEVSKWIEAEMFRRLTAGTKMGAAKLVQSIGHRVWKDGSDIALIAAGLDPYEQKLKSPSDIEKEYGSVGKKIASSHAFKPDKGLTVAPADDRRSEQKALTPAAAFANVKI